jgi:hypothetical protein
MKEMVAESLPRLPKHEVDDITKRVWHRLQAEMAKRDLSLRSIYGDGWSAPALTQSEYQILTAISQLKGERASELRIWAKADELSVSGVSGFPGALHKLTKRGLITAQMQVTEDGERALARARAEGKDLATAGNEDRCTAM